MIIMTLHFVIKHHGGHKPYDAFLYKKRPKNNY